MSKTGGIGLGVVNPPIYAIGLRLHPRWTRALFLGHATGIYRRLGR